MVLSIGKKSLNKPTFLISRTKPISTKSSIGAGNKPFSIAIFNCIQTEYNLTSKWVQIKIKLTLSGIWIELELNLNWPQIEFNFTCIYLATWNSVVAFGFLASPTIERALAFSYCSQE